jgi:hypothetical protein
MSSFPFLPQPSLRAQVSGHVHSYVLRYYGRAYANAWYHNVSSLAVIDSWAYSPLGMRCTVLCARQSHLTPAAVGTRGRL